MDLVDIGKVLDELEFNEENNSDNSGSGAPPAEISQHTSQNDSICHHHPSSSAMATSSSSKHVVTVSNVMMSLNEYVNAGIDQDRTKNTATVIVHPPTISATNSSGGSIADATCNEIFPASDDNCSQLSRDQLLSTSETSSNFKKFSDPKVFSEDGTSSYSHTVTTTSDSFGVLPSGSTSSSMSRDAAGVAYNVKSLVDGQEPCDIDLGKYHAVENDDGDDDDDDDYDENGIVDKTSFVSESKVNNDKCELEPDGEYANKSTNNEINDQTSIVDEDDNKNVHTEQLSSVSSYCVHSSSSPGLSNETINVEEISSMSSVLQSYTNDQKSANGDDHGAASVARQLSEDRPPNTNAPPPPHAAVPYNSKVVIGFESTMDDVSDTELESYLQELEAEQPISIGGSYVMQKESSPPNQTTSNTFDMSAPDAKDAAALALQFGQQSQQLDEKNSMNADSFSQASTVEFAELRLHSDFDVMNPKSLAATLLPTDEEFSLEAAPIVEPEAISITDFKLEDNKLPKLEFLDNAVTLVREDDTYETSPGISNTPAEVPADADNAEHDDVAATFEARDIGAIIDKKLDRPNSLELPAPILERVTNSSPGHTPPPARGNASSAADSILTSSSEEYTSPNAAAAEITNDNPTTTNPNATTSDDNATAADTSATQISQLGKDKPYWIPDNIANFCMQCNIKFSLLKRRHHCRACGQVLCSTCCSRKAKLEYMSDAEARVCLVCDLILNQNEENAAAVAAAAASDSGYIDAAASSSRSPNPNNPMEYCSVIPPHKQVANSSLSPISVMVPVGVLKREGAPKSGRKDKNVIFSDGIRPGCDLAELDINWDAKPTSPNYRKPDSRRPLTTSSGDSSLSSTKVPEMDRHTHSFIPSEGDHLPPLFSSTKSEVTFKDVANDQYLVERLEKETLKFAVQRNFFVYLKVIHLKCCVNKTVLNFTTQGLCHVGQDEIIILLEMNESTLVPKDIFVHLNEIYTDASKGQTITELGFSLPEMPCFLGSKEHGGFLYIRPTFQCLQHIHLPENPYLIGVLIHRWEVPWAKVFPLRLMLRLGALYRYYPSPHISVRGRNSVYAEIAQTIINFLADFRNYTYTLPTIRGMYIHMEDRKTTALIPRNRYDQVIKAIDNSSDNILALGGNFSKKADGHLVCFQNTESGCAETYSYSTQAINIHGKPRKITGTSFLILNSGLKSSSGLSGKCNIVEDGLMVQVLPSKMGEIHKALKAMQDVSIVCGPVDSDPSQTETVSLQWTDDDTDFNIGVLSPIDCKFLTGIPNIRVHRGFDMSTPNRLIRWTEVFIIKSEDDTSHGKDPIDISKLSESIAKCTSKVLVELVELLALSGRMKIGLRATISQNSVSYEAGSQYEKLSPLYMNALDNVLIQELHQQATTLQIDSPIVIELIFHILDR